MCILSQNTCEESEGQTKSSENTKNGGIWEYLQLQLSQV